MRPSVVVSLMDATSGNRTVLNTSGENFRRRVKQQQADSAS
ncbi:hypothetical protein OESDEN_24463 [Oesophagostomum dentatum]|uniref:Uncharacterized protein n=1 Tax=Oesophagostomum dentatum TaxID=61180 RepID=A0A0B1RS69_OESDE|nr:hypothetical protein OESDEN_24463 [Oesophagostomum dentatum]